MPEDEAAVHKRPLVRLSIHSMPRGVGAQAGSKAQRRFVDSWCCSALKSSVKGSPVATARRHFADDAALRARTRQLFDLLCGELYGTIVTPK
jgi:hypothetical protein